METENGNSLERFQKKILPPLSLEKEIIQALKSNKIIKEKVGFFQDSKTIAAVVMLAASILLFLGTNLNMLTTTGLNDNYLLVLYESDSFEIDASARKEYEDWAYSLMNENHLLSGAELNKNAIRVSAEEGKMTGGEGVSQLQIGGYFILSVNTIDEAKKIAATCPHVKYGGVIDIHAIK